MAAPSSDASIENPLLESPDRIFRLYLSIYPSIYQTELRLIQAQRESHARFPRREGAARTRGGEVQLESPGLESQTRSPRPRLGLIAAAHQQARGGAGPEAVAEPLGEVGCEQ